jgi:hypothetical protein
VRRLLALLLVVLSSCSGADSEGASNKCVRQGQSSICVVHDDFTFRAETRSLTPRSPVKLLFEDGSSERSADAGGGLSIGKTSGWHRLVAIEATAADGSAIVFRGERYDLVKR